MNQHILPVGGVESPSGRGRNLWRSLLDLDDGSDIQCLETSANRETAPCPVELPNLGVEMMKIAGQGRDLPPRVNRPHQCVDLLRRRAVGAGGLEKLRELDATWGHTGVQSQRGLQRSDCGCAVLQRPALQLRDQTPNLRGVRASLGLLVQRLGGLEIQLRKLPRIPNGV